jgi:hypothetical protein
MDRCDCIYRYVLSLMFYIGAVSSDYHYVFHWCSVIWLSLCFSLVQCHLTIIMFFIGAVSSDYHYVFHWCSVIWLSICFQTVFISSTFLHFCFVCWIEKMFRGQPFNFLGWRVGWYDFAHPQGQKNVCTGNKNQPTSDYFCFLDMKNIFFNQISRW